MALTFWRRRPIAPMAMPRRTPDAAPRRAAEPIGPRDDDYLVEGSEEPMRPSVAAQIVQLMQVVLIVILAALSFTIFWLLAVMLNLF